MDRFGEEFKDVVNLILESTRKHLICLIEEKLADAVKTECPTVDHIIDTTGSSDNNVDTILKGADIVTDSSSSDTSMDLNIHEVSKSDNNLLNLLSQLTGGSEDKTLTSTISLVESGKSSNCESCGFSLKL